MSRNALIVIDLQNDFLLEPHGLLLKHYSKEYFHQMINNIEKVSNHVQLIIYIMSNYDVHKKKPNPKPLIIKNQKFPSNTDYLASGHCNFVQDSLNYALKERKVIIYIKR